MLSPDELLRVARAYADATGLSLITVGRASCGNDKIYGRIEAGHGASSRSIEEASAWFRFNWPPGAHWPPGVPGRPRRMVPHRRRKVPDDGGNPGAGEVSCAVAAGES